MKITYICHATLLIETHGIKILTDPWIFGPAYCEQWYQFPPASADTESLIQDIDYIILTHGHEDHLHHATLSKVNKSAHVYFPYSWYEGSTAYFKELGFTKFTEGFNEKRYALSEHVHFTYLANNLDNIFVLEDRDKILVNVNDALTSAPKGIITYFIQRIHDKWPVVDYLLCSYGGASYYPNTIKCDWKNDKEVGLIREQFFLDNFCTIAKGINARYSIPFASDFVLLEIEQRWMNEVKFPRQQIPAYFEKYFQDHSCTTEIKIMYPGDTADNESFKKNSSFHEQLQHVAINDLVETIYKDEITKKKNRPHLTPLAFQNLYHKVQEHVKKKAYIIPTEKALQLKFCIQLTDAPDESFIEINLKDSSLEKRVRLDAVPEDDDVLLLKIKSASLLYSISNEWGGDAIVIGYGCEILVYKKESILQELDNYAIQLLTNYPNTKEYIQRNPIRALNYLFRDQIKRKLLLNKLAGKKNGPSFMDPVLKDNELWLTRSNCEICKKCNLPIMTDDLAEGL